MNEREEEKSRGFKVQDRRRFSAEGDAKPEAEPTPPQPAAAEAPAPEAMATAGASPRGAEAAGEINFTAFVVSLSTQILVHLGEMEDPLTNQGARDLPAARHLIDILGMLAEKTRGNLDGDEDALLRSILFDLRMKYVEATRHLAR